MFATFKLLCLLPVVVLLAGNGRAAKAQAAQPDSRQRYIRPASMRGKQTFSSTCAGCHGLDGKGSERAPSIADRPNVQRLSDSQIFRIIENGIPGTGMPAFHSLENSQIKAVVAYLRTLQGTTTAVKLPGDPERGRTIFVEKAGCSGCHMIAGQGGFIGSDLSAYGRIHGVDEIRSAIVKPTPSGDRQVRIATATSRGEKYAGRVRNEDNFSLQLQGLDGTFYFLSKSDIDNLEYESQALMPSDYSSKLNASELDDVVSYLISAASASAREAPRKQNEEE
jgi:cytochrome c oxidase cbb3-type subunit III